MTEPEDFWGALPAPQSVRLPARILREQAALLGQKTKNLLEGKVFSLGDKDDFRYDLDVHVPVMNNYSVTLISISHGIASYPVRVLNHIDVLNEFAENEARYIELLKHYLGKGGIPSTIRSLLALADEAAKG